MADSKLGEVKRFLPNRYVVGVLVFLGAFMGMYFVAIQQASEHLTGRNTYYLSDVAKSLRSTAEAVAFLPSYSDSLIGAQRNPKPEPLEDDLAPQPEPTPEVKLSNLGCNNSPVEIGEVQEKLRERLMASNALFTRSNQITVSKLKVDFDQCGVQPPSTYDYGPKGLKVEGYSKKLVSCNGQRECWAPKITLMVPYEHIRGISDIPEYFHSIVLANSASHEVYFHSATVGSNPEERHGSIDLRSARAERITSIQKLDYTYRQLLQTQISKGTEGEAADYEGTAFGHTEIVPFDMNSKQYMAFVQPTAIKLGGKTPAGNAHVTVVGIVEKSAFDRNRMSINLVLFTYIALCIVLVIVVLPILRLFLITPLGLIYRRDWALVSISVPAILSLLMILIYSMMTQWSFEEHTDGQMNLVWTQMSSGITSELDAKFEVLSEIEAAHLSSPQAVDQGDMEAGEDSKPRGGIKQHSWSVLPSGESFTSRSASEYVHPDRCDYLEISKPALNTVFWLDQSGKRTQTCLSRIRYPSTKPDDDKDLYRTNLSSRAYFKTIRDRQGWYPVRNQQAFGYVGRIESKIDGNMETVLSQAVQAIPGSTPTLTSVAITRLNSLEQAVLPHGFGFALFEKNSGKVLFHHLDDRSLRENFFSATDDNPDLFSLVASDSSDILDVKYKGEATRMRVERVPNTPWILVVYFDVALQEAQMFHSSVLALIMTAILFGLIVLAFTGVKVFAGLRSTLFFPGSDRLPTLLATSYAFYFAAFLVWGFAMAAQTETAILHPASMVIAVVLILNRDFLFSMIAGFKLILWLDALMVAIVLWLVLSVQELDKSMLVVALSLIFGGLHFDYFLRKNAHLDYFSANKSYRSPKISEHQAVSYRARNLTRISFHFMLVILFVAVFPTISILKQNFNLHERGWVNFNNWHDVNGIERAYSKYRDGLVRYEPSRKMDTENFPTWLSSDGAEQLYLPCTRMSDLSDPPSDKQHALPACDSSHNALTANDHPGAYVRQLRFADQLYSNTEEDRRCSIALTQADSPNEPEAIRYLWLTNNELKRADFVNCSGEYLSGLLTYVPRFSDASSVLVRSHGGDSGWLLESGACTPKGGGPQLLCSAVQAQETRSTFFFTSYYPHTQNGGIGGYSVSLIVLATIAMLGCALARAVLARLIPNRTHTATTGAFDPHGWNQITGDTATQICLANLAYYNVTNTQNVRSLQFLMELGWIRETPLRYVLDERVRSEVRERITLDKLTIKTAAESEGLWRQLRAPVLLLAFGLLFIAAYATQDKATLVVEILGSVATMWVFLKDSLSKVGAG